MELAKGKGGSGQLWEGALKYSPCPSPCWASPYHELPHRPVVGHTEISTPMELPATVREPNDAGASQRGLGKPHGHSSGPIRQIDVKVLGLPERAVPKPIHLSCRHTKQTPV